MVKFFFHFILFYLSPSAPITLISSGRKSVISFGGVVLGVNFGHCDISDTDNPAINVLIKETKNIIDFILDFI